MSDPGRVRKGHGESGPEGRQPLWTNLFIYNLVGMVAMNSKGVAVPNQGGRLQGGRTLYECKKARRFMRSWCRKPQALALVWSLD